MLEKAAELAGASAFVSEGLTGALRAWFSSLSPGTASMSQAPIASDGEYVIFAPGSEVAILHQGSLVDRKLIEPKFFNVGATKMLMYRYDTGGHGDAWVPHDQIQPSGQEWHYAIWNPTTGEIKDTEMSDGNF
jgi:DEAD/DEAH box helicase domain-containing protein